MGRIVRDPEVRYSKGAKPVAVARYTLAVNRRFKRQGEQDADFISCVAFGKNGEFAEKYMRQGGLFSVVGRLQVRSWDDKEGKKHWTTEVVVEEHYFAESKMAAAAVGAAADVSGNSNASAGEGVPAGFYPIDESIEDNDLPF